MLTMNGFYNGSTSPVHTARSSSYYQYQSTGDLRSSTQLRGSWYDLPSRNTAMTSSRQHLVGMAPLSRSMIQLNQLNPQLTYQHLKPSTAGSYRVPNETSYGRLSAATLPQQQQATTVLQQDFSGTTKRRRRRPLTTASASNWYPDDESVFSEPVAPSNQVQRNMPSADYVRLRQRTPPRHRSSYQPLSVASSTLGPRRQSPEQSLVDLELKNVDKAGDRYHITMSVNAAQQQAVQQQPMTIEHQEVMTQRTMARTQQPGGLMSPSFVANNQPIIGSTTVVHVRGENFDQNVNNTPKTVAQPPVQRLVRSVSATDTGYRIKSVRSMSDLRDIDDTMSMRSLSRKRLVGGVDDKVGFDVEVQQPISRPSSVMLETRSVQMKNEKSLERRRKVIDGNPPSYSMNINETLTMNYEPPSGGEQRNVSETYQRVTQDFEDDLKARPRRMADAATSDTEVKKKPRSKKKPDNESPQELVKESFTQSAPPKLFNEQSIQATTPQSVATQTNKDRGTQTDKENTPPDNLLSASAEPVARGGRRTPDPPVRPDRNRAPKSLPTDNRGDVNNNNGGNPESVDFLRNLLDNGENDDDFGFPDTDVVNLPVTRSMAPMAPDVVDGFSAVNENPSFRPTNEQPRQPNMAAPAAPFGFSGRGSSGNRIDFARQLNVGAPEGSVKQKEHRHVEEEEITRMMLERLDYEGRQDDGQDAVLNLDSVSEKVDLVLANGTAQVTVVVRCETIVPVRDSTDMFKKSTVTVTKIIEVDLLVTNERRQLYEYIIAHQRRSATGRLSNRDTFDLYQTFMEMARQDELVGRQAQQQIRIDRQVDEQRFLDFQVTDRKSRVRDNRFDRIDGQLNAVHSSPDVDVRAQSSLVRRSRPQRGMQ